MAYLAKKIEQVYVLWFEASNQWVLFNEQQWFIFKLYKKEVSQEAALKRFSKRYSLNKGHAQVLLASSYDSIQKLFHPNFDLPNFTLQTDGAASYALSKKKSHSYTYLNKPFSITYGSPFLENYIHFPIAHLEVETSDESTLSLETFYFENRYILRANGTESKCFSAEEPGQIKRLLYIELVNFFYNKQSSDWLSFVHASALKKNNEAILLTATGGSGKSTMAGLLQLNGFEFISDDFVPLDTKNHKVFPFPAALCVKNDAVSLLESKGFHFQTTLNKTAYAKVLQKPTKAKAYDVKKLVFIKYNKNTEIIFEPLSSLEALYFFLQEAWVGDDITRAKKFIDWFVTLKFYKLEYGNNEKAIDVLTKLMD